MARFRGFESREPATETLYNCMDIQRTVRRALAVTKLSLNYVEVEFGMLRAREFVSRYYWYGARYRISCTKPRIQSAATQLTISVTQ
jgi:hypothetical protein